MTSQSELSHQRIAVSLFVVNSYGRLSGQEIVAILSEKYTREVLWDCANVLTSDMKTLAAKMQALADAEASKSGAIAKICAFDCTPSQLYIVMKPHMDETDPFKYNQFKTKHDDLKSIREVILRAILHDDTVQGA